MSKILIKKSAIALAIGIAFAGSAVAENHIAVINQESAGAAEIGNEV